MTEARENGYRRPRHCPRCERRCSPYSSVALGVFPDGTRTLVRYYVCARCSITWKTTQDLPPERGPIVIRA
jgi:hypothetical protein